MVRFFFKSFDVNRGQRVKMLFIRGKGPGVPLTDFNNGGVPTEVHILYPKKSQLQNLSTPKNH